MAYAPNKVVLKNGLVWFYDISTISGYLMSNPVFTYIQNTWFVNIFCRYKHLNDQAVLFSNRSI